MLAEHLDYVVTIGFKVTSLVTKVLFNFAAGISIFFYASDEILDSIAAGTILLLWRRFTDYFRASRQ